MKRTHITKAIALVMTVMMLIGCVPASVLPVFAATDSAQSIFDTVTLGKGTVTNTESYMASSSGAYPETFVQMFKDMGVTDAAINVMVDPRLSPYEPYATEDDDHPFLPGGSAWMDLSKIYYGAPATQNYPLTKWSANTSVYNIHQHNGKYAFKDLDLIDGYVWNGEARDERLPGEKGSASSVDSYIHTNYKAIGAKNGTEAFAYNRYDAMQGKYGITLDKNVSWARWQPSYKEDYYKEKDAATDTDDLYQSVLYLSDTPYLYFSTEAPDTTKMAISLLIGTQVQTETGSGNTTAVPTHKYEYRWYTITDNTQRPGIGNDTMNYSMIPNVTISDVVATCEGNSWTAGSQQSSTVMAELTGNEADPLALAGAAKAETMYVDGAITGCIDFTNILPLIYPNGVNEAEKGNGRYGIQYKIAQIRVDTKTAEGAENSTSRINYMYFGPSLSTVFTPQNIVGSDRDANSYLKKQTTANSVGNTEAPSGTNAGSSNDRAYTSGWENGEAVSITNTPNDPQKIVVDIYGKGDGQLIEWADVPAGADIIRGNNTTGARPSKVWKFTDNNGVVQYMEAQFNTQEHSGIDNSYYVMVTIPVRKWISVLGDSRKISLTATLLHEGTQYPSAHLKPTFVLWGNESGSVGAGHAGPGYGPRFKNEDLIMVFGTDGQTYHTDQGQDYVAAQVDRTIGDSLFYNTGSATKESWFDVLRSPYTYDETVKGTSAAFLTTDAMVGYTYITNMRFAMPIGSAIQIQNMKGDNNSAGLNAYSTTGAIVSAYDGGTGEQPNINVTSTVPEYQMTYNSTSKKFSSTTLDSNGIKGNITSGSAAYGPMLLESKYTIYDLLDTEMLRGTGNESHHSDYLGKNKQPIYGEVWKANYDSNGDGKVSIDDGVPIYHQPTDIGSASCYGHLYGDSQAVIYGTVIFTDKNRTKWGLTGVLTTNGSTEIGWIKIWDSSHGAYLSRIGGVLHPDLNEKEMTTTQYKNGNVARAIMKALRNDWVISDFSSIDEGADFRNGSNVNFEYTEDFRKQNNSALESATGIKPYPYHPAQNIISQSYSGPQLKYANKWTGSYHYSSGYSLQDFYLRSINGTDMEWGFTRKVNTTGNMSMAMTRAFNDTIWLRQGKTNQHASYPVLYLDYTSNTSFKIGISARVDGKDKIWYVDDNKITTADNSLNAGNHYAYLSFEDLITKDYKGAEKIELTGISLYMWNGTSVSNANVVLRRCEVWQEETQWYDEIIAANQQSGGDTSTAMNSKVYDSMNIVNDSYFNRHSEADDGEITVTKKGSYASDKVIGINNASRGYEYTYTDGTKSTAMDYWEGNTHLKYNRTESYRKNNSNKGWKAYVRLDSSGDGNLGANDATYYSYDAYEVDGVYQYVTSLGHLRVWVPSKTQASVVFEADRSFNTSNYRYLYYSYSMRDADTGISAEEPDTARDDGLKPGIAVSIKETQLGSAQAYSEIMLADGTRTWAYYPPGSAYWANSTQDNRTFKTTINAAADLSTFDGIESVNQFVFYLNNPMGTLNDGNNTEFYINYLYLSNTPPEDLIANKINEEIYQYYYMMDNTGDRYSARFPTLDNPTGQVTGLTAAADRVNPVKVVRGARLSDATYFNGQPLYGYDGYASKSTYDKNKDGFTGSMKDIMFYTGTGGDDITAYYDYKDAATGGKGDIFDMKWSYGRWDTGSGESALNTMYIGQKNDESLSETKNQISGALTRRYATENYVLLRSGITPKKYVTYYDADGGEFLYESSPDNVQNLQKVTENSYYITQNVILSYFTQPDSLDVMKGETGAGENTFLKKPGYVFSHWEHYIDGVTVDNTFNVGSDGESTSPDGNGARFMKFIKKTGATVDYFKAVWVRNDDVNDPCGPGKSYTATLYSDQAGTTRWASLTASRPSLPASNASQAVKDQFAKDDAAAQNGGNGYFMVTLPKATYIVGVRRETIYGWMVKGDDSRVYAPGEKIYLLADTEFVPVTDPSTNAAANVLCDIRLKDATLEVLTTSGMYRPIEKHGVTVSGPDKNGYYTYSNVPTNFNLRAVPTKAQSGYGWVLADTQAMNGENYGILPAANSVTILSGNKDYYYFTAHESLWINYTTISANKSTTFYKNQPDAYVYLSVNSMLDVTDSDRRHFTSQFELPSNSTVLKYGTMYTKTSYLNFNGDALNTTDALSKMCLTNVTAATVANKTYKTGDPTGVRYIEATDKSDFNEFTLLIERSAKPGNHVMYYARSYVIYKDSSGTIKVAYSNIIAYDYAESKV